jgi:2-dehydro-3-deoxygluconokinase
MSDLVPADEADDSGHLVAFGETMLRLSPPRDEPLETADQVDVYAAGAESNAAVAATRVGASATWLSSVPAGPAGDRVIRALEGYGIETAVHRPDDGRQGLYFVETGGQPRGISVTYDRTGTAIRNATVADLPTEVVGGADVFLTSGITLALSEQLRETTSTLLTEADAAGMKTALDLNYRSKLWDPETARETIESLLDAVSVLIVAERDAATVLNHEAGQPSQLAHALAADYDLETLVLTRGDKGAVVWHDSVLHEQPALAADTLDPIGTGDAFAGAFLGRRIQGDDVTTALEYAAAAAALKRTVPGDVLTVTQDRIEDVVASDEEAIDR